MGSSPSYGLPPDQPDHKAVNTTCFRTSTIAALEAMEVPIEFAEVRFKDVLKKLAEQTVSQHCTLGSSTLLRRKKSIFEIQFKRPKNLLFCVAGTLLKGKIEIEICF